MGKLPPLTQLQAFADWEKEHNPDPSDRKHVAQWAVEQIESLLAENARLRAALSRRKDRAAFETWISAPPFERDVGRYPEDVDLAWEAWQEAQARKK